MKFDEVKIAFAEDGTLRDIYVSQCNLQSWSLFFEFVKEHEFGFSISGNQSDIPVSLQDLWQPNSGLARLEIKLDFLSIISTIFAEDEIELFVDPRQILNQNSLDDLLNFMSALGTRLDRDVLLTEENSIDQVWFRFDAGAKKMKFHPV